MMNYYQKKLFYNISYKDYESMRECLSARERHFQEDETICTYGVDVSSVGIIAKGCASIVRYEINGTRTILEHLGPQDIFGESLAFCNPSFGTVSVVCDEDCDILFFDYEYLTGSCSKACRCHQQLIQNLLNIISEKTMMLGERIEVLSKRTIREKLICCFLQMARKTGRNEFRLPFTMVDLADYLSVDRSAMTRELKKMKDEQLLEIDKKTVRIADLIN